MKKPNLTYSQKRQIALSVIAVISLIITILGCVFLIYTIYGQALFSSQKVQSKKAENYANAAESTEKDGIVFVGDSIFELYQLDKYYKNKDYINRGISSNKSADVLKRLQSNVIDIQPKMVIIHVGTNDLGHGVSAEDYISNMFAIISSIEQNLPNCKIFIDSIYPTITLHNYNSMNLTKYRKNDNINNFNDKLKNLCKTKNITFIDTHSCLLVGNELNREFTIDGLHLNDAGYKSVTREIMHHIEQAI